MFCGVTECQRQLGSGHHCTCTGTSETHLLVRVVPAKELIKICNLGHDLQQFKGICIRISTSCPFGLGHKV